jgi:hypothetical protein
MGQTPGVEEKGDSLLVRQEGRPVGRVARGFHEPAPALRLDAEDTLPESCVPASKVAKIALAWLR